MWLSAPLSFLFVFLTSTFSLLRVVVIVFISDRLTIMLLVSVFSLEVSCFGGMYPFSLFVLYGFSVKKAYTVTKGGFGGILPLIQRHRQMVLQPCVAGCSLCHVVS